MDNKNRDKCAHPSCNCNAAQDSKYCSPHCETLKTTSEIACQYGHPHCVGTGAWEPEFRG